MENPPIDVTGLGLNAMDTICMVPRFPEPNGKTRISQMRVEPGGQVATALITCARLGLKARYIGYVGDDHVGRAQLESLRAEGIELEVREEKGAASQTTNILLEDVLGELMMSW